MRLIKDLIKIGFSYLKDLFPEDNDIRLEEIENDDDGLWLITYSLSDIPPTKQPSAVQLLTSGSIDKRRFKVLTIDRVSGEVLSMKIRTLNDVH